MQDTPSAQEYSVSVYAPLPKVIPDSLSGYPAYSHSCGESLHHFAEHSRFYSTTPSDVRSSIFPCTACLGSQREQRLTHKARYACFTIKLLPRKIRSARQGDNPCAVCLMSVDDPTAIDPPTAQAGRFTSGVVGCHCAAVAPESTAYTMMP